MAADNVFSDLSRMIEQVGKDKGIDRNIVVDAVIQGMLVAARKKYGTYRDIEAQYNEDSGEVELFEFKEVVTPEEYCDPEIEIQIDEAKELDPDAQLHDSIGIKLESGDLGRIAAQMAKQIITQKVRDAEREIIYNEFEQRKGEVASGIVRRVDRNAVVVDLGRTEAYIPTREQIPGELYKPGDRIQGYIADVRQTTRGPQIIMSRADENYLVKLFEMEVPEIYDGLVQVMAAAREPGQRAKVAVVSRDTAVDPVGACVGMKGSRVQNIVQELQGEKIDIVQWEEDVTRFACNALAPAEISKVFLDESNKEMEVVVPDNQLSLAIGRKGQNVRLAAKLTTWKLDILSESNASAKTAESILSLMQIAGMTDTMAQNFYQSGFGSHQAVAAADINDVMSVPGYEDREKAEKIIEDAKNVIEQVKTQPLAAPSESKESTRLDAKGLADARLKQEFARFKEEQSASESGQEQPATEEEAATDEAPVEDKADESEQIEASAPSEGADVSAKDPEPSSSSQAEEKVD